MVDEAVGLEEIKKTEYQIVNPERFASTALVFRRKLEENGYKSLDELIESVVALEAEFDSYSISDSEFEILCLASYLLGVTKKNVEAKKGPVPIEPEAVKKARLEAIELQQRAVKIVLSNADAKTGRYDKGLAKHFLTISSVFAKYFQEDSEISDIGAQTESGFLRGVRGMITAALLFDSADWKVALPDAEEDLLGNVDLIVSSPKGKVFEIDVTAKRPQKDRYEEPFYIEQAGNSIRINIPPLSYPASEGFYRKDISRAIGFPSQQTIQQFNKLMANVA